MMVRDRDRDRIMKIYMNDVEYISTAIRTLDGETLNVCEIVLNSGHTLTFDTGMAIDIVTEGEGDVIDKSYILIEPLPND
jgi:hypothetical protein